MASTMDMILNGAGALRSGAVLDSDTISGETPTAPTSSRVVDDTDESVARAENSESGDLFGSDQTEESSSEPASTAEAPQSKQKTPGTKETITVVDENGKRRTVEVDFSNKEDLKKRIQSAFGAQNGMRKFQLERDNERNAHATTRKDRDDLKANWDKLEEIRQAQGIEGLVDVLEGRRGAYKDWLKQQIDRHEFVKNASPEEKELLETREREQVRDRELAKIRKENEEFRKQMTETKDQADMRSLESRVNPVFDKYRFADKLGSADDEHMFDEMLWNSALKRLEPYEDQGLELNPELIDREFRSVAQAIRRRISVQADKRVSKVIEQKKQEATENAQAKVMSGYKTGGVAQEASELIKSNNLTSLLKNWNKYGSVFNK